MPTATSSESSELLSLAFDSHRAGKLEDAVSLYRRSLPYVAMNPQSIILQAAVHNNLGAALRGLKDNQGAVEAFTQAITLMPDYPEAHLNLGVIRMEQLEFEDAVASFRRALELRPNCAEAYNNMGAALRRLGKLQESENAFLQALAFKPGYLSAQMNLAVVYQEQHKLDLAAELLFTVVEKNPTCAEAYLNLGMVFHKQGNFQSASELFHKVQELKPDYAESYINSAAVLKDLRQLEAAEMTAKIAVELKPDSPEAHLNLGTILHDQGNFQAAAESYSRAIALRPDYVEALSELGSVLLLQNDGSGTKYLRQALRLNPHYPAGHWSLAVALLRLGEYNAGWEEYEWRWAWSGFPSPQRSFRQPLWRGELLNGETILLHAEQGLGDTLQFVRYAPLVAERGGRVILEVQPALQRLLSNLPGIEQVIARGDSLPDFQWQCPLMSLPLAFKTTLETIPALVPYIKTPQAAQPNTSTEKDLKVGLVWSGNPAHKGDLLRTIPSKELASLSNIEGVDFVALQQGLTAEQKATAFSVLPMEWKSFEDFVETAQAIEALDLVISIDTSVAHLAGAMGKPVWILLAHATDWRWLTDRDDSPWYPTARLFRQTVLNDWTDVLNRVADNLRKPAC